MATAEMSRWQERLHIPAYRVVEAARYARTSTQTVRHWQKSKNGRARVVSARERGASLSYFQLVEVGVVAAMRKAGVRLSKIRQAREYLIEKLGSAYPFAEYRFKTDGKNLFLGYDQVGKSSDKDKLLSVNENGQIACEILSQRLREFEYDADLGTVLRWRVDGVDSPVMVDPRIAFGAPQVCGVATWVISQRWMSGEGLTDIADDYGLEPHLVARALRFEAIEVDPERPNQWAH